MGAHALVLQARGHKVTALDLIPETVRVMQERGVEDARKGTLFELPSAKVYDTVILLMNGVMIAETLSRLDRLLAAAARVLEPRGALILDSTDLRDVMHAEDEGALENKSENSPESESTHEPENDTQGGRDDDDLYIGELHYQLSVGEHVGDVFPQLFVDPDTLDAQARRAGWNTEVLWSGPDGRYLARLQRPVRSVPNDAAG